MSSLNLTNCFKKCSRLAVCRRLLFAKDFKRHMEAADVLLTQLPGLRREVMSCMDLLLRWLVLRICEANTQCLLKVLDLTKALLELMVDQVPFQQDPKKRHQSSESLKERALKAHNTIDANSTEWDVNYSIKNQHGVSIC